MSYSSSIGDVDVRAPDGSGNNLGGQAFSEYIRLTPNSYVDGLGEMLLPQAPLGPFPSFLEPFTDYDGPAARPRDITDAFMAQPRDADGNDIETPNPFGVNENFQFFGQFVTHDMVDGAFFTAINAGKANAPLADPIALDAVPFPFQRVDSNIHSNGVREQVQEETSFLDLSQVYGSDQNMLDLLRDDDDPAKLVVHDGNMLATLGDISADSGMSVPDASAILRLTGPDGVVPIADMYATGDQRANQSPLLLSYQTMFMREHNRLVDEIRANPEYANWSDEEVFNAARALNEAQWQAIVYHEYLPKLLGDSAIADYSGYKAGVDPGVTNEWSTVGFRFGHDQSSNTDLRIAEDGTVVETVELGECFERSTDGGAYGSLNGSGDVVAQNEQLDEYVRGLTQRVTQDIDGRVVDGNRNALFGLTLPDGSFATCDLEAIDIQRGRDHGVDNLNRLLEGLGLDTYGSIDEFISRNGVNQVTGPALKSVYGDDINTVDSVVAALLEKNVAGSMLGEISHVLTVDQFERTRDGDQLFYLNRFKDNPDLIKEIEGTSFADLIMRNTDTTVYRDAFLTYNRTTGAGGSDRDLVIGSSANNNLGGGQNNDDLYGYDGNDRLAGGRGSDLFNGGAGDDQLRGGNGSDIFVFQGSVGRDVVASFQNNTDVIDISDYDLEFADVQAQARTSGSSVEIDIGAAHGGPAGVDIIRMTNTTLGQIDASDFIFD